MKTTILKQHWSKKIAKMQTLNQQNERLNIGSNHTDIRFRLTQLAIKFSL